MGAMADGGKAKKGKGKGKERSRKAATQQKLTPARTHAKVQISQCITWVDGVRMADNGRRQGGTGKHGRASALTPAGRLNRRSCQQARYKLAC